MRNCEFEDGNAQGNIPCIEDGGSVSLCILMQTSASDARVDNPAFVRILTYAHALRREWTGAGYQRHMRRTVLVLIQQNKY